MIVCVLVEDFQFCLFRVIHVCCGYSRNKMVEGRGSGGIICRYHPPMKKKYIDNKKNIPFITKEQFKHFIASYIDREILIKYMFFENFSNKFIGFK